jgi:hypothetical protein
MVQSGLSSMVDGLRETIVFFSSSGAVPELTTETPDTGDTEQ